MTERFPPKLGLGARALLALDMPGDYKTKARRGGVSTTMLNRAKRVRASGSATLIAAIWEGKLTVDAALRLVPFSDDEQRVAIQRIVDAGHRSTGLDALRAPMRVQRRPLGWRMQRTLDQLENAVELLGDFITEPEAHRHLDQTAWLKTVARARGELTKLLRDMRAWRKSLGADRDEIRPVQDRMAPDQGPDAAPEGAAPVPEGLGGGDRRELRPG